MKRLVILGAFCALASCANQPTALSVFIGAETLDTAALAGFTVYEKTPGASQTVEAKVMALQAQVDSAFAPLEAQAQAGEPIGDTALALAAVQALVAYDGANGINVANPAAPSAATSPSAAAQGVK